MQLTTFLSATAAMVATASAALSAVELNAECNQARPYARIINRCDYPVHLWSVQKGMGCPDDGMVTLKKGEIYNENYQNDTKTGVSIKVSKTNQCKGTDIVQLEYFLNYEQDYSFNFLDVSYVDCLGEDCPTRSEGYYLQAGDQKGAATASAGNTWCPILACNDAISCSKLSYVLPDDVQTKTCDHDSNMDFYMCGGEAPTEDDSSSPAPSSASSAASVAPSSASSKQAQSSATSTQVESSTLSATSVMDDYNVKIAAVTSAPAVKDVEEQLRKTKTHVEVVYVTVSEYVNAKRHAHGHARRHQPFNA